MCGHVRGHVGRQVCVGMCVGMCVDVCVHVNMCMMYMHLSTCTGGHDYTGHNYIGQNYITVLDPRTVALAAMTIQAITI